MSYGIIHIKFKVRHLHCSFLLCMGPNSLCEIVRIENHHVLSREMNLETHYWRFLMVNGILKETPCGLRCSDVLTVSEFVDLVVLLYF